MNVLRLRGSGACQSIWRAAQRGLCSQQQRGAWSDAEVEHDFRPNDRKTSPHLQRFLEKPGVLDPTCFDEYLLDHNEIRTACETSRDMVKAPVERQQRMFKLSAVDQMYQLAGFNFTYFYKGHGLQPALMKRALQGVLGEVPHLAGRGRLLGKGSRLIDSVIECNNEGVEFVTASAPGFRLQDVGPHTWSRLSSSTTLANAPMAFYDQPLNPSAARTGKVAPLGLRLTDLADGQVLSISGWHVLADAGRAIKLVTRLSEHYRAFASRHPVQGLPLRADNSLFHSPEHLKEALAEDMGRDWEPKPATWAPNVKMTLKQHLSTPLEMYRSLTSLWDVHTLYLPQHVVARVKTATTAAGGGYRVTTADAIQAMLFTMISDIRGRPLVPTGHQLFTTTADMLHGLKLRDANLVEQYLGNALEIVFLEGGDTRWEPNRYANKQDKLMAAIAANARLIHEGVAAYRANERAALNSVAGFHAMVRMPSLRVARDYIMKGVLQKCASSSYIVKFPLHQADFGGGAPHHVKTDILPWSDWWFSSVAALGIDDGKGILCRMVLERGTAKKLKGHPLWSTLAAGAQLAAAGEAAAPFGTAAAQEEPPAAAGYGGSNAERPANSYSHNLGEARTATRNQ